MRLADVAGPHPGGEPVDRGVGQRDRFLRVVERDDHQDRAEDLLRATVIELSTPVEHRRLHEVALAVDVGGGAAGRDLGALLAARLDVSEDAVALLLGNQRAEPGLGVERIAGLQALGAGDELLEQLVVGLPLDEEP